MRLLLILFRTGFSVQRRCVPAYCHADVQRTGIYQGRCIHGRLCLIHRYDHHLPYPFPTTTRSILLTVCPILIVCNLITMHTSNIALMIVVCFISGFFRMWGTFECFSNMRLTITPAGDFSTFYPVIYIIVLESIQLS